MPSSSTRRTKKFLRGSASSLEFQQGTVNVGFMDPKPAQIPMLVHGLFLQWLKEVKPIARQSIRDIEGILDHPTESPQ